jgi:hypothetical protein
MISGESSAFITCDWHYDRVSWPHVADKGSIDIGIGQFSAIFQVMIGVQNGLPYVDVISKSAAIGEMVIWLISET